MLQKSLDVSIWLHFNGGVCRKSQTYETLSDQVICICMEAVIVIHEY